MLVCPYVRLSVRMNAEISKTIRDSLLYRIPFLTVLNPELCSLFTHFNAHSHIFPFYVNLPAQMANCPRAQTDHAHTHTHSPLNVRKGNANPQLSGTLCWLLKAYFWAAMRWWGGEWGQVHNFPIALFYVRLMGCPYGCPFIRTRSSFIAVQCKQQHRHKRSRKRFKISLF